MNYRCIAMRAGQVITADRAAALAVGAPRIPVAPVKNIWLWVKTKRNPLVNIKIAGIIMVVFIIL